MVAQLVPAAAVAAQHQMTTRVQGEGVARHARQSYVPLAVRVPSCCLEEQPKRLFIVMATSVGGGAERFLRGGPTEK